MKDRLNVSEMWDKCPTMIRGIYFIYNSIKRVFYTYKMYLSSLYIESKRIYTQPIETKNQDVKEVRLIKKHKPKFNIQHL